MKEWKQWADETKANARPWLLVGDGPTLARCGEFGTAEMATLALGVAARQTESDAVFLADDAAIAAFGLASSSDTRPILVPRALASRSELANWNAPEQIVVFDPPADAPAGDAALALTMLAALGVQKIRTLGVGDDFGPTPGALSVGDALAAVIQKYSLDCGPLTSQVPARVFLGSDPSQAIGARVLEYSIRKHCTLSSVCDTMQHVVVPLPRDPANQPRTQFSFNRFVIPSLTNYRGRALYLDADMLVFSDLRELWETPFGDAKVLCAPSSGESRARQTSVMLMDCQNLAWDVNKIVEDLDSGKYDYDGLMRDMKLEPSDAVQDTLPLEWNMLEEYKPNRTRLIHYTDMKTQPWVSRKNKHGDLWVTALRDALADGFITQDEVMQAIDDGYVRPSLAAQLKLPPALWPAFLKTAGSLLDKNYTPHQALRKRLTSAGLSDFASPGKRK